ncbi:LOW QUALITY PROTEIN: uncharacterized protein LOC116531200 [Sapajus apella]|uniref:LOW QUALITY PROTEIN: uncharacterized protein LOC116531200 n=1 Tax=Sapajus apella TaxID=9515 RepID=A0A6J3FJG6_SAPAP|nr:LOW QUALITY PROTEIN: uncharacterized protein LOC116531200 [Sapajus apella]
MGTPPADGNPASDGDPPVKRAPSRCCFSISISPSSAPGLSWHGPSSELLPFSRVPSVSSSAGGSGHGLVLWLLGPGPPGSVWRGRQCSSRPSVVSAGEAWLVFVPPGGWCGCPLEAGVGAPWRLVRRPMEVGVCAARRLVRRPLEAGAKVKVPSALPRASWLPRCCPLPGLRGGVPLAASSREAPLILWKFAEQPPRPLLPRSLCSPRGLAWLSPQAAHLSPADAASPFPLREEAMERLPGSGQPPIPQQPAGRRRKTPGSRRPRRQEGRPGLRHVSCPRAAAGRSLPCCCPSVPILQVVKPSIVLTPQFLSHDQGQLTKELQQHVKSVPSSCKYLRKVSECRQTGPGALEQFLVSAAPRLTGGHAGGSVGSHSTGFFLLFPSMQVLCAQAFERKTAERKPAYKKHRKRKQRVPKRHMSEEPVQKRLCLENAFWRADSGPHSVPMRNSSCVPTENTEKTKVNMAAAQHRHCSGLPYSPYLMADPSKPLMACQPPPPSGCHLGAQPFPSAKGVLGPLTNPQLQCPLGPQPPSPTDNFWGPQTPTHECFLASLPPSAGHDFLSPYTTPPECLLTPLPPPTDDEFLRLQTPTYEGVLLPLPSLANDFLSPYTTPPECLLTPLPPSTDDEFSRPQTPTYDGVLLPLPLLANDFLSPYTTPPECLLTPLPPSTDDEF